MKETKLKLVDYIFNEATDEELEAMEQLFIYKDFIYGKELLEDIENEM